MILIYEKAVPEGERADLAKVNAQLESLAALRLAQIDLRDEPYCLSRIAWQIAIFSNAMVHRFVALAEGVAISWNASNSLSAVLNARAAMETFAFYYDFGKRLSQLVPSNDFEAINQLITKCLFGTMDQELLKEFPEFKLRSIMNSIDAVDEDVLPGFRGHYETLSEFCHPNSFGHRGLFSARDRATGITTFEMRQNFIIPLKAAFGLAGLFERSHRSIDSDLRALAQAHHAAHPSPLNFGGLDDG
ncbi:hypothetical protein JQ604_15230 [Bradyrhizobium jicamae]|uniref:hypothetical protein n=1 Tax=Bradyrhizobium jicamae TaxID=280332 RepID=UPI001BAA5198|nr:hypothetical protein [Bradyrhizobium jicamae]MBR0753540.1 hypothetical protein [Bradyrhizobium jicamae]